MTAIWALTGPSGCAEDRGTTRQGDGDRAAEAPAGASHQSRVMERAKAQPRERSEPCARRSQPGSGAPGFPGGPSSARRSRGRDWRLTTQRSAEDEEEAARERRRRARDRELRAQDEDGGQSPEPPEQESLLSLKPSEAPELDEDEGFSDWSQKPEPQRQPWEAGGASNSGEPPRSESPEGQQEENRPHQHAYGSQGGDEQSPARVSLEELHLSPSSELQDGPGTEETEPKSPEGTVQGSLGPAEAQESDEQHQKRQQPRTPSPLVLEGATEQGSPPLSPSTKLIDRTESLNRSIRKSNSVKKSQPPLPISKIDERLEQYTQAIETAGRTPKLTRQPSIELPSMAVASTKSRWETGEVQAQSTAKTPSCKDIVAGDMSKKSLWEQKGGSKTSSTIKSTPSGKRYKFVATGHGKYEKVLVDEGSVP
ncbi:lymphocyte-specific protein 1 isoform X2 [Prionailurus viverrinus]|uniref:lymphocyte-specific protein 1 isoform X2 n=1 Tax=Prionailurus viverrinus TaxID=61388 RepID=UPI001FF55128|nr:lymphocyte-specific protein 1 isoform X2 [Prionailurus viverrinus]XP_047733489.1 lymphocyte-specific protein 1 isoform X2 [Prionailurus viverrinus]